MCNLLERADSILIKLHESRERLDDDNRIYIDT